MELFDVPIKKLKEVTMTVSIKEKINKVKEIAKSKQKIWLEKFNIEDIKLIDKIFYFLSQLSYVLTGESDFEKSFEVKKGWIKLKDTNLIDREILKKYFFIEKNGMFIRPILLNKKYLEKFAA
jgi:hypothetical protein